VIVWNDFLKLEVRKLAWVESGSGSVGCAADIDTSNFGNLALSLGNNFRLALAEIVVSTGRCYTNCKLDAVKSHHEVKESQQDQKQFHKSEAYEDSGQIRGLLRSR
jgi:hypothetical protein